MSSIIIGLLTLLLLGSVPIFAATSLYISGYTIPASSSLKQSSILNGFYTNFLHDTFSAEFEYDKFTYTDDTASQQNIVFILSDHSNPYTHLRLGINQVQQNKGTPGSIYFGGAAFDQYDIYGVLHSKVGADFYLSFYKYSSSDVTIWQFNPWMSHYFFSAIVPGALSVTSRGRVQILSNDFGHGTLLSGAEIEFSDQIYPLTLTSKFWMGSSQFGVYENGFAVYNNADLMTTGFGISAKYHLSPAISLTLGYQYYTLYLNNSSNRGDLEKVMLMASYSL